MSPDHPQEQDAAEERRERRKSQRVAREIAGRCVVMRTRRLSRQITRLYDDALRPHGVTAGQLNLLVGIALLGPVRAVDLGQQFEMEKSTLSRNLRPMLEAGWIRSQAATGNAKELEITPVGESLLATVRPAWRRAQKAAQQLLGDALHHELLELPTDASVVF